MCDNSDGLLGNLPYSSRRVISALFVSFANSVIQNRNPMTCPAIHRVFALSFKAMEMVTVIIWLV